jgi:hypothetical protein
VAVALEQAPALELREPAQPLHLDQLCHPMQLGEVLLDPSVGQVGERLDAERLERGAQLAHATTVEGA